MIFDELLMNMQRGAAVGESDFLLTLSFGPKSFLFSPLITVRY